MSVVVIPRSVWGAMYGTGDKDPGPEGRVVIHHSYKPALDRTASYDEEAAAVRGIEGYHVAENGWAGIGYNWLVAPSGRVFEGRGWKYRGAHAGPVNGDSIGICLLINGTVQQPTREAIAAVRHMISEGVRLEEIREDYTISGHRDHMARTCPGDLVYARLAEFRHDAGLAEIPAPSGELAVPTAEPPAPEPPNLERIIVPTPAHIDEAVRVSSRWDADRVRDGIALVEVLLRGMQRGNVKHVAPALIANVLSEWLNRK